MSDATPTFLASWRRLSQTMLLVFRRRRSARCRFKPVPPPFSFSFPCRSRACWFGALLRTRVCARKLYLVHTGVPCAMCSVARLGSGGVGGYVAPKRRRNTVGCGETLAMGEPTYTNVVARACRSARRTSGAPVDSWSRLFVLFHSHVRVVFGCTINIGPRTIVYNIVGTDQARYATGNQGQLSTGRSATRRKGGGAIGGDACHVFGVAVRRFRF